jgi:hypothetical protein
VRGGADVLVDPDRVRVARCDVTSRITVAMSAAGFIETARR